LTYGNLRHGEAVAIGIAIDALYSHRIGRISEFELEKILLTLEGIGFRLYSDGLLHLDVQTALNSFREHLGGELTITLLDGIGRKFEAHRIDIALMQECINTLIIR
jgi:3-dehydroquinate synthase